MKIRVKYMFQFDNMVIVSKIYYRDNCYFLMLLSRLLQSLNHLMSKLDYKAKRYMHN